MLSPKKPKPGVEAAGKLLLLDQYDFAVDKPAIQDALNDVVARLENDEILTSQSFEPHDLAAFLTRCIEACHDALDNQQDAPPRQARWYHDLRFAVGDAPANCCGESISLNQAIAGGHGSSAGGGEVFYWDPVEGNPTNNLTLPAEAEGSWVETVSQAAKDARYLFGVGRLRLFVLALAFNEDEKALRFLIFHRGGLTASEACNIAEPGGLKEVGRLFLTLALWTTPGDAGFIPFFTETEYALPADESGKDYVIATVDEVLSRSPEIRGKATVVSRVHLPHSSPAEGGFFHEQCSNSTLTLPQVVIF
jgi:hypothetical protein